MQGKENSFFFFNNKTAKNLTYRVDIVINRKKQQLKITYN